jgi:hypothetical protein
MADQPPADRPPPGYPPVPPAAGGASENVGGAAPPAAPPAPQGAYDPYAAERALEEWASEKGYTLSKSPELSWYQGWYPFQYVFRLARIGRELRATFGAATLHVIEGFEADQLKAAAGEDRYLMAFILSPQLTLRVAIRSKSGGGVVNDLTRGLGSLFGGSAGGVLGDPALEQRFEVWAPSREEGNRALPMPLRQHLLQTGWRGVMETRPGGMACVFYGYRGFEPRALDTLIATAGQLYQLAAAAT